MHVKDALYFKYWNWGSMIKFKHQNSNGGYEGKILEKKNNVGIAKLYKWKIVGLMRLLKNLIIAVPFSLP